MPDHHNVVAELVEQHKLIRRLALGWAITLITFVVIRVTEPSVIVQIGVGGATIVTAVIGLLATVVGLYQVHRNQEDSRRPPMPRQQWPRGSQHHVEEHW